MQFGRRSEQIDAEIEQLQLALDTLEAKSTTAPTIVEPPTTPVPTKPVRKPLPQHLPREEHRHEPVAECPDCGAGA